MSKAIDGKHISDHVDAHEKVWNPLHWKSAKLPASSVAQLNNSLLTCLNSPLTRPIVFGVLLSD